MDEGNENIISPVITGRKYWLPHTVQNIIWPWCP